MRCEHRITADGYFLDTEVSAPLGRHMTTDTIVQFDFSEALTRLKQGKPMRRVEWGEHWLRLSQGVGGEWQFISHQPDCAPRAVREMATRNLLATDWVEVEEPLTEAEPHHSRRTPAKLDEFIEKIRRA